MSKACKETIINKLECVRSGTSPTEKWRRGLEGMANVLQGTGGSAVKHKYENIQ